MRTGIDSDIIGRAAGILPDWMIKKYIKISPMAEGEARPGKISYGITSYGYDARLGRSFRLFSNVRASGKIIDPKEISEDCFEKFEDVNFCIIPPNSYLLGETFETFEIPRDIVADCIGKSTYARCGIICNLTPLEPEWRGKITIEISNASPLPAKIYAEEGICQIRFFRTLADCRVSYADKAGGKAKYQDQKGLTLPRVD